MPAKKFLIGFGIFALGALVVFFLIDTFGDDDSPPPEPPKPHVKKIQVYLSGQVKNISVVELEDSGSLRV
ncbi:MAG: hypothetical protein IKN27_07555, partial [Selenomonadaceae bacterium]|nr:hypothetical protein [Selenomonadaceae bacterium]